MSYHDIAFANSTGTMIDATRDADGERLTLTESDPLLGADFAAIVEGYTKGEIAVAAYVAPAVPPEVATARMQAAAQFAIDAGYAGRRVSLASYYTLLERLDRKGRASADQETDLATLDAAAEWEQAVLDAAAAGLAAGKTPGDIAWPAAPEALAALAAQS